MIGSLIKLKLTKMALSAAVTTALCVCGAILVMSHLVPALWIPMLILSAIALILSLLTIKLSTVIGVTLSVICGATLAWLASPFLLG